MATFKVGGKDVEIKSVPVDSVRTDDSNGRSGVNSFIKETIEGAAAQGQAIKIIDLSVSLIEHFKVTPEETEATGRKSLPDDQARTRINNVISGSKGKYVKVKTGDGFVAVTTLDAIKKGGTAPKTV